ncbi:MAG: hypothetical protein WHS38_03325 [Thermodesulforhabdaceae bacterium]
MRNSVILIAGIILQGTGYGLLYSVSPEASFERVVNQVFAGIISTVIGAIFVALFFFRRSR